MKRTLEKANEAAPLPPSPAPVPVLPLETQYLFIISNGEQGDREVRFFSCTVTPANALLVEALINDLDEDFRTSGSDESRYLFDIFTYLCGDWKGPRLPRAFPYHLWTTPLANFGAWEELEDDAFFSESGTWTRVVHAVFYGNEGNTDETDRSVSDGDWENQVNEEKAEEELRRAREQK